MPAPRTCVACGRTITWRRAWADDWEHVRWCSKRCRRGGVDASAAALEAAIVALLDVAPNGASIRPTDAARAVAAAQRRPHELTTLDAPARAAALRLAAAGEVDIMVGSEVVDPSTARGDITIRRIRRVEP